MSANVLKRRTEVVGLTRDPTLVGTVYRELRQSLIDMDTLFNLQSVGLNIKVSRLVHSRGLPKLTFCFAGLAHGRSSCSPTTTFSLRRHYLQGRLLRLPPFSTHLPKPLLHHPIRFQSRLCRRKRMRQIHRLPSLVPVLRSYLWNHLDQRTRSQGRSARKSAPTDWCRAARDSPVPFGRHGEHSVRSIGGDG